MQFRIGDMANGVETSADIIRVEDELEALRYLVSYANLYCVKVCNGCGISLQEKEEQEDGNCANCQADEDRKDKDYAKTINKITK